MDRQEWCQSGKYDDRAVIQAVGPNNPQLVELLKDMLADIRRLTETLSFVQGMVEGHQLKIHGE
jgi:hypothetical protein